MAKDVSKVPVQQVMANISAHLDQLAGRIFDVEQTLGETLTSQSAEATSITKFQSLDFVRQSLEDCALLVHYMSTPMEPDRLQEFSVSNLSSKLKLDATKALLHSPVERNGSSNKPENEGGDVDLF